VTSPSGSDTGAVTRQSAHLRLGPRPPVSVPDPVDVRPCRVQSSRNRAPPARLRDFIWRVEGDGGCWTTRDQEGSPHYTWDDAGSRWIPTDGAEQVWRLLQRAGSACDAPSILAFDDAGRARWRWQEERYGWEPFST